MSIIRITESMRKDPKQILILNKKIKNRYQITITKAKAWFHTYTDYEVEIVDLKSNKRVYQNSSNDQDNGINRALSYFNQLNTLKSVIYYVKQPWGKY